MPTPANSTPPKGSSSPVSASEPGIEAQDVQAPERAAEGRTGLRDQLDAAIRPVMLLGLQDAELDGAGGTQRINEWADWIVETVLGVRDDELARLRAQVEMLTARLAVTSTQALDAVSVFYDERELIERDRDRYRAGWRSARRRAARLRAQLAEVRRFNELTAESSSRVEAARQARDTLAILNQPHTSTAG